MIMLVDHLTLQQKCCWRERHIKIIDVPLTFQMLKLPSSEDAKIFKNHLIPVVLVSIGKLFLSRIRWVPMCQGLYQFFSFSLIIFSLMNTSQVGSTTILTFIATYLINQTLSRWRYNNPTSANKSWMVSKPCNYWIIMPTLI